MSTTPPSRPADEAALAACERDLRRLNRSPRTIAEVLAVARAFLAGARRAPRAGGTPDDVRAFLARRRGAVAAATQATELSRLRSFFLALVRLGLVREDPTAGLVAPRRAPRAVRLLTPGEVARLLVVAAAPAAPGAAARARALRDRAVVEVLYALGLRSSEARAARLADLDLRAGALLVRRAKGGRPEVLPLPPAALTALRAYLRDGRPNLAGRAGRDEGYGRDEGRLLLADDGRPLRPTGPNKLLARLGRRAGVPAVHPHALRRAVATHLVEAGVAVDVVQRLLGHQRLTTTQRYVEVDRAALRRAVQALELR